MGSAIPRPPSPPPRRPPAFPRDSLCADLDECPRGIDDGRRNVPAIVVNRRLLRHDQRNIESRATRFHAPSPSLPPPSLSLSLASPSLEITRRAASFPARINPDLSRDSLSRQSGATWWEGGFSEDRGGLRFRFSVAGGGGDGGGGGGSSAASPAAYSLSISGKVEKRRYAYTYTLVEEQ